VDADVREPGKIVAESRETLDFGEPVAVVMNHLLNYVGRDAEVRSILSTLMEAVCPGSYLVVVHPASDLDQSLVEAARRWNKVSTTQVVLRSKPEVTAWFGGLEIIDPGVVTVTEWRPDSTGDTYETPIPMYGIVGRKPAA
jgi:O-methyltransferase involved in polyketide biosynthesis